MISGMVNEASASAASQPRSAPARAEQSSLPNPTAAALISKRAPHCLHNLTPLINNRNNKFEEREEKTRSISACLCCPLARLMRRKKHLDRGGGGGGGTELFICFTSRPSASSKAFSPGRSGGAAGGGSGNGAGGAGAADAPPAALLRPSLSRRLRNSGSLKGGQSPMFPPGTASGGRRGRGGMEPAEPSSPKVTCIGQVRVKGGKRKPKHGSAAALRSRSRRGVGGGGLSGSEASFRRGVDDRDGAGGGLHPGAKNQGWVYQIPVNICEALKTFGSCGGRSLCSPSRERGGAGGAPRSGAGDKKRRRAPAGGSWLCGAAVARCLLAIQEEEDDVGKGSAVGPADEARESQVGLVMQGWDVEDDDETRIVVGEVEVEKEDEILLVGGKEEEGRVSVCIPPRNALLLMRCRSDPVRMAELATRFWGSPAAATASVGQVDNEKVGGFEKEEEDEGEANLEKECAEEARNSAVSADGEVCGKHGVVEDDGGEAGDAGQVGSEDESSKHGDIGEEEDDGGCRGDAQEKDEPAEEQIVRKDVGLEVEAAKSESQAPAMVEAVADTKDKEDAGAPRMQKEEEEVKGRRSVSSCSPSTALKEDRKLRRLGSTRRRVSTSSKASLSSDRVDRRHSFSAEMEARRSSFSSLKDSRRASFSIDRDGRRWSFTIEQEHLVAEPKVLMASRKGKKNSSEAESEKDCPVLVAAPNSVEEAQECNEDGKEEATNGDGEEEGTTTQCAEVHTEAEKVETGVDEKKAVKQEQRKKSGELPDCLLMMMCEPKLSMEVSKETWVCSTDFVHWKSHQGQNRRQQKAAATGSNAAAASEETKGDSSNAPDTSVAKEDTSVAKEDTSVAKDTEESTVVPAPANSASMPPQAAPKPSPKPVMEQKLKLEIPKVAAGVAAYAPLVLKRCKSEPLRSSARLAPDTCFWKEDRHRPLNATGIGF